MARPVTTVKTKGAVLGLLGIADKQAKRRLRLPVTVIGRGPRCDIALNSSTVSSAHCVLCTDGEHFILSDLASRTGVRVNDLLVLEIALEDGMNIQVGRFHFRFELTNGQSVKWGPTRYDEPAEGKVTELLCEHEFELAKDVTLIGAREGADIRLADPAVSRSQAILVRTRAGVILRDLGSRNGTLVNGESVGQCLLDSGDEITIGPFSLYFQEQPPGGHRLAALDGPQPRTTPTEPTDRSRHGAADDSTLDSTAIQ